MNHESSVGNVFAEVEFDQHFFSGSLTLGSSVELSGRAPTWETRSVIQLLAHVPMDFGPD